MKDEVVRTHSSHGVVVVRFVWPLLLPLFPSALKKSSAAVPVLDALYWALGVEATLCRIPYNLDARPCV